MASLLNLVLGLIILVVSAIMGAILLLAPGSIRLQRPECGWVGWAFNIVNLLFFFLLIPLSGLIRMEVLDIDLFLSFEIANPLTSMILEVIGLSLFLKGSVLLLWSRLSLRRSFRLGGVMPAAEDYLTMHGPYVHLRHPMYLSAILVVLGVALILLSQVLLLMAIIMLVLIWRLIPREEEQLEQAYPLAYSEYCRRVPRRMVTKNL